MSTLNAIPFRSTIFYRSDGTVAPLGTVFTIGTNNTMSTTNNISLNTFSASTIISFSTITASTIRTTGASIAIGQNVSNPNRYVEIRSDIANSSYLDFHSSDSAVPDFSTRIQSLGGATTGTGALNMTASTIGLVANVGIGTTVPTAGLHIKNATTAMRITGNLNNASSRPAVTIRPGACEIRGSSAIDGADDGFFRLSAGGGTSVGTQAYIDLSGYSTVADMNSNIIFGAAGSERMRITNGGTVGIGTDAPNAIFHIRDAAASSPSIPFMALSPNLPAAGAQFLYFGKANSNNNTAQIGWFNIADGSALNYAVLQIYGKANIMTWQASTGNVGIGITNPGVALHVIGSILGSSFSSVNGTVNANPGGSVPVYTCGDYQSGFILFRWGNGYAMYYFTQYPGVTSSFINYICGQSNAYTLGAVSNSAKVIAITMAAGAPNPTTVYWTVLSMTA
jgi:hypothetical protein